MRALLSPILLLVVSTAAGAAEIKNNNVLACSEMGPHDRVFEMIKARDQAAVTALIKRYLTTGECRAMDAGEKVRVERGGFVFACVAPLGSPDGCFWVESRHVDVRR